MRLRQDPLQIRAGHAVKSPVRKETTPARLLISMRPVLIAESNLNAGRDLGFEVETPVSVFVDKLKNLTVPSTVAEVHGLPLTCPSMNCFVNHTAYIHGPGHTWAAQRKLLQDVKMAR